MQLLTIHPTPLQHYLDTLKPFLSKYFLNEDQKTRAPRIGRPRVAPAWLLVALALIRIKIGFTYRGFYEALNTDENRSLLKTRNTGLKTSLLKQLFTGHGTTP